MADHPVSNNDLEFKPWREVWQVHPDADRMPMASESEQKQLNLDIHENGMLTPILFLISGDYEPEDDAADERIAMLDGRNRLDQLHELGHRFAHPAGRGPLWRSPEGMINSLYCRYEHVDDVPFPFSRVVSLNVTRRHLSTKQKRNVIETLLEYMPDNSDRELARQVGVDNKTVASVRQHLEALGKLVPQEETLGGDGRWRSRPRRAPKPEGPETVKIEKDSLVRLRAARYARDSGDLFKWGHGESAQKIAHVLVTDGIAQGATLDKVGDVARLMSLEVKKLEREARDAQRAEAERAGTAPAKTTSDPEKMTRREFEALVDGYRQRLGKLAVADVTKRYTGGRFPQDWQPILDELAKLQPDAQ